MHGKTQNRGREIKTEYGFVRMVVQNGRLFLGLVSPWKDGLPLNRKEVDATIRGLRKLRKDLK